jgi:hypothetical protein
MIATRYSGRFSLFFLVFGLCLDLSSASAGGRKSGDYYTSDLVNAHIAIGPVAEGRINAPDTIANRKVALSIEDIQRDFAEGLLDIHRAATITRISGKGGVEGALDAARHKRADLLIMPRIEELVIDEAGRNGLDSVAKIVDVVLFPITIAEAVIYRGERAGVGAQYMPVHDMRVTMKMTLDYYRVSDGAPLGRQDVPRVLDAKVNKDNLEGARYESTDDWIQVGRDQGAFLIKETGREIAKEMIPDLVNKARGSR